VVPEIEPDAAHRPATNGIVRDLRWTLELRSHRESQELQTIAVAGSATAAGTSSVALAMGISFARTGTSTALVDLRSDPRRLRELLAPTSADHSTDPSVPKEVDTGIRNLTLVDALALGPANELPSRAIQTLFQDLRARYEVVLVDCGSLGDTEGVLPACAMADGSILVCARGSDASDLRTAAERLRASESRLLGTIFNRAAPDDTQGHAVRGADDVGQVMDERFRHLGPLAATVMQTQCAEV